MTIPVTLPGIEVQSLHSNILNRDLQLYIKLPWSYDRSDTVYPVLYCTDANRSFPIYSTMSLIYETPGPETPEILIVGVGYKVDPDRMKALAQWTIWRTHDLTPVNRIDIDQWWQHRLSPLVDGEKVEVQSGAAADFLNCIQKEIIPFIEAQYRVSPTDRGLAGFSYGGLFTLYTLFHAPELFIRYFAGSPTMWQQLFLDEENYASTHTDLSAKLFITAGSNETELLKDLNGFIERLRSRNYPGLDLITHIFEGVGHASSYAASVSRALCVLYNQAWLKL
jgi:predicted alpha/beta superfamily hydrolase